MGCLHYSSSAQCSSLDKADSNLADWLVHVQIVLRIARNVASHQNHHCTSNKRADEEEPEPRPEEPLLERAGTSWLDGVAAEGCVDKDQDDAEDFDGANEGDQNAVQVSQLI